MNLKWKEVGCSKYRKIYGGKIGGMGRMFKELGRREWDGKASGMRRKVLMYASKIGKSCLYERRRLWRECY